MWTRKLARSSGKCYLYNASTGESKWPCHAVYNTIPRPVSDTSCGQEIRSENNQWKREMISRYVKPGDHVVDLACCRGGDLHKFMHAGAGSYVGVDISPVCVKEAETRAEQMPPTSGMSTRLVVCDLALERIPCMDRSIDVVSCQFALHYLANKHAHMMNMLSEIARVLKNNGYFIFTVPDHIQIRSILAGEQQPPSCMHIENGPGGVPGSDSTLAQYPWGHGYFFEFRGRTPRCEEYVVFPPTLEDMARGVGLHLVRRAGAVGIYTGWVYCVGKGPPTTNP